MKKERLYFLVKQYRDGTISDLELEELKSHIDQVNTDDLLDTVFTQLAEKHPLMPVERTPENILFSQINTDIERRRSQTRMARLRKLRYTTVTAAAVILIGITAILWNPYGNKGTDTTDNSVAYEDRIVPGNSKAKIILEDGREIDLETLPLDTVLSLDGYALVKNSQGEISYRVADENAPDINRFNTIIVPKGGEYKLTLPDDSEVWLNASSTLKYPLSFGKESRKVTLSGEAYFSVTKKKTGAHQLPFIVHTGNQKLEVLGTQFNINSYSPTIKTTLVEGAVQLSYPNGITEKLRPNQQSVYDDPSGSVSVQEVNPYYTIAWKDGGFAFDNATLREVMDCLARWYDITVDYKIDHSSMRFTGSLSRYEHIEKLLQTIAMTNSVKFEIKGRRIMVLK